eukprot:1912772-Prymnesium_polylepis.2
MVSLRSIVYSKLCGTCTSTEVEVSFSKSGKKRLLLILAFQPAVSDWSDSSPRIRADEAWLLVPTLSLHASFDRLIRSGRDWVGTTSSTGSTVVVRFEATRSGVRTTLRVSAASSR